MKKLTYIFDSFAVIAYLQAEPGGQEVRELLKKSDTGKISVLMSAINDSVDLLSFQKNWHNMVSPMLNLQQYVVFDFSKSE